MSVKVSLFADICWYAKIGKVGYDYDHGVLTSEGVILKILDTGDEKCRGIHHSEQLHTGRGMKAFLESSNNAFKFLHSSPLPSTELAKRRTVLIIMSLRYVIPSAAMYSR